jgi:hypothetical protein
MPAAERVFDHALVSLKSTGSKGFRALGLERHRELQRLVTRTAKPPALRKMKEHRRATERETSLDGYTQVPLLLSTFADEWNTSPITSGPTAHSSCGRLRFKRAGGEDIMLSLFEKRGRCHVSRVTVCVARASRPLGRYLLKTTMASISSPTDEAPLQPGIRSIVSLAAAHTQKVYFSGTVGYDSGIGPRSQWEAFNTVHPRRLVEDYRGHRLRLTGSIMSVRRQGEKFSLSSVNVANAVCLLFHPRYLCGSTKPSSLVHRSLRKRNQHQRWEWVGLPPHLLLHSGSRFMGCCFPTLAVGEITPRGDLYRPSHPDYH